MRIHWMMANGQMGSPLFCLVDVRNSDLRKIFWRVGHNLGLNAKLCLILHYIKMDDPLVCKFCGKGYGTPRALTQHQQRNDVCATKARIEIVGGDENFNAAYDYLFCSEIMGNEKLAKGHSINVSTVLHSKIIASNGPNKMDELVYDSGHVYEEYDEDEYGNMFPVGSDIDYDSEDYGEVEAEFEPLGINHPDPVPTIRANFQEYCKAFALEFEEDLKQNVASAIQLMDCLRKTKASLDTYEAVMKWHCIQSGHLREDMGLGLFQDYVSRKSLFKFLSKRYNFHQKNYNMIQEITLPGTRAKAKVIINDAQAVMQSLLTDPRIVDDDYLFFNDDPLSPPPADLDYIADLNTGLSYTKTYAKLIKKPGKQVLLPVPFYIDGAATGQFTALNVTAVKFTLGIFTRKARDRPHFWRILGYLPTITKVKSRGRRILFESGHVDGTMAHYGSTVGEGNTTGAKANVAQDLHTMLELILESFIPLQERGFVWDLRYKGKVYEGIEFVPFVPFIKCDTEEADRLCGKYISRGRGVAQLCRYCYCPTSESDDPLASYPAKEMSKIMEILRIENPKERAEKLKAISQQDIENVWYLIRFGKHSKAGVHGACPFDMLHFLLLGIFMYTRDCFFEQLGENSGIASEIDALAVEYGALFSRQSDRDLPKTKFSGGIREGKITGKEFPGILLLMAALIRSQHGRNLLLDPKSGKFASETYLQDWIMLIESLLQWEQWLKSDEMTVSDVKRSERKHRYIMYLLKKVGKRVKGMGLKLTKFHAITHLSQDILNFGVPLEVDTGSNESGHKPVKTAAKLTQKRPDTFDEQVGQRNNEVHLIEIASEELQGRKIWNYSDYGDDYDYKERKTPEIKAPCLGGAAFCVYYDEEKGKNVMKMMSRSAGKMTKVEQDFVDYLMYLQSNLQGLDPNGLILRTNHYRYGHTFRGSPHHSGQVWRDWAMFDWGEDYGKLPGKIWGFVDFTSLPDDNDARYAANSDLEPALYAIIESAEWVNDPIEVQRSEIFTPILKEVKTIKHGRVTKLKFYLANVESLADPVAVIPDLGGAPNAYFVCKSRSTWREDFVNWLRDPFEDIPESDSDDE